ncbi:hypothetical protein GSS88_00605 [Corynebacterium sp. 3HC-13]|uniref:cell division protein PerM n=1 Tax=Corynebacterium poyangense TaxID=2684405 RepID=UPI001CCDAEC0|nr:DUF6350 family protein [Corynebacterium poyangense]MBZ8176308.1 hypothetical protein [Corynebacterium poyangense]
MSNQDSPRTRPGSRRPHTIKRRGLRFGSTKKRRENTVVPTTFKARLLHYLPTVAIPNVTMVLIIIAISLLILMLSGTTLVALPATIAIGWLVTNLIPVSAGGVSFGVLPLVPALTFVTLLSRQIHRAVKHRVSIADLGVITGLVIVVPLLLTGIASLMLLSASAVFDVNLPPLFPTLSRVVVLHLCALIMGMGTRLWRALFRRYGIPETVADDIRTARHFLARLASIAFLVYLLFFILGLSRQSDILAAYHEPGALDIAGLVIISLCYLPQAVLAVAAALVGGEYHVGDASLSLFNIHLVPLPPLALFGAMPSTAASWAPLFLIIPAGLALLSVWRHRPTWRSAVISGSCAFIIALIVGWLSSGNLAAYGQTGPLLFLSAGLVFLWLGGIGLLGALFSGIQDWWTRRQQQQWVDHEPEPQPDIPSEEPAGSVEPEPQAEEERGNFDEEDLEEEDTTPDLDVEETSAEKQTLADTEAEAEITGEDSKEQTAPKDESTELND